MMQSHDFTYAEGDNGEQLSTQVIWCDDSSSHAEASKPIGNTVLIFHFGGLVIGNNSGRPDSQVHYLAKQNFVVVVPNYRLCPQVSAHAGPFADAVAASRWCRNTLPALLKDSHQVAVDGTRLAAMGYSTGGTLALWLATQPSPPRSIASFFPTLYLSDTTSSAHQPYGGFPPAPDYEPTAENEDALFNRGDGGRQLSSFDIAPPGTTPPQPRQLWFFTQIRNGTWMRAIQPDENYHLIDPCAHFADKGPHWPATIFVQGDKDDVPGSGIAHVERAAADLKAAGAATVRIETVEGAPHNFTAFPGADVGAPGRKAEAVQAALDFLREHV
ncbi:hypothetical protein MMC07_006780 [Pseudocyphellaria aurata]|nr:hypothetical protein [Pseudocyphellaria aurata]